MIEIRNLVRRYGALTAVDGLTFSIQRGEICGFIGPNGAGKTTTIRILATLLAPTGGDATIGGHSVSHDRMEVRRILGYMPDTFGVYEDMLVEEYLHFFAAMYRIAPEKREKTVDEILQLTDLTAKKGALIKTMSRGNQQRLGLARVLVHSPEVLLLDEPASGLDPRARIEIRALIAELGKMKKTILVSSHILREMSDLCDSIAIIEAGRLVYKGPVSEALKKAAGGLVVEFKVAAEPQKALDTVGAIEGVKRVWEADGLLLGEFDRLDRDITVVPEALVRAGLKVTLFKEAVADLEDAFMSLTKGGGKIS
ncbi:MAG: ABC transporter ATP-binding protein [Planctomycetes bacterium]|nr:ABC transporter ATP-binding protein [Planctomycetota bacterium]